jgi:1-acyl-sn-glycerol-3-phosphate acyltransferase
MKKQIYKWIFSNLMGWKIIGGIDEKIEKCVLMVMPHTSWHDFYIAIICRGATGIDINWVGKKELFRFPFGGFFKYMGGAPLDRSGGLNIVDSIVAIFDSKKTFRLGLSPEGTRKKVDQLKTGFYYIALKANVPIITVALDFGTKTVRFGKPVIPSGNIDSDLTILKAHFIGVKGKIPEKGFEIK